MQSLAQPHCLRISRASSRRRRCYRRRPRRPSRKIRSEQEVDWLRALAMCAAHTSSTHTVQHVRMLACRATSDARERDELLGSRRLEARSSTRGARELLLDLDSAAHAAAARGAKASPPKEIGAFADFAAATASLAACTFFYLLLRAPHASRFNRARQVNKELASHASASGRRERTNSACGRRIFIAAVSFPSQSRRVPE